MAGFRAAGFAALFAFFGAMSASAQDVTLTSRDGGVEISGDLLGYDGEFYRVDTIYGELTVDGSGVTCEGPGCPNLADYVAELRMSGASALGAVMMPALLETFAGINGYVARGRRDGETGFHYDLYDGDTDALVARFDFGSTTTSEGFADLLTDEADIALATREIRPEERERARDAGLGDLADARRSRILALDAIVPIVSPGNPVQEIQPQDLALAFAGRITNWQDLGGPDAPIALHLADAGTGLGQLVEDRLLAPAQLTLDAQVTRHARSLAVADAVTADPFALGIASFAETGDAQILTLTGACGFPLRPDRFTIKTEDYPLTTPIFTYLPARRLPKIGREFVAFLRSPEAQLVIRRVGFVDQTPEEIPVAAQGRRLSNAILAAGEEIPLEELQRMAVTLSPMRRLTISFRFETGSIRLDAQSRANVLGLAHMLEVGRYDGRKLVFMGFSDGEGAARANREIALKRAEAVRYAVMDAAQASDLRRVTLEVDAFGEALPLACDDSAWGRKSNRRVEVWVR